VVLTNFRGGFSMTLPLGPSTGATGASAVTGAGGTGAAASGATGVGTASSISSAAGYCSVSGFTDWVASVWNAIRSCLAKLPGIGSYFESAATTTSSTAVTTAVLDTDLRDLIFAHFLAPIVTTTAGTSSSTGLDAALIAYYKSLLVQIQSPLAKMQAFHRVLVATNSSNAIAFEFFNALPAPMQDAAKGHIYAANGNSSVFNGHDHMGGFGDYMVNNQIDHLVVRNGIAAYVAALQAAASSSTGASGGP
jgi:hypothetical protein